MFSLSLCFLETTKVLQDICLDNVLGKNKAPAIPISAPVEEVALRKVSLHNIHSLKFHDLFLRNITTVEKPGV